MPPFQSSRRFDPYEDSPPNSGNHRNTSTFRHQQRLSSPHVSLRNRDGGDIRPPIGSSSRPSFTGYTGPQHIRPSVTYEKKHRLDAIGRILASDNNNEYDRPIRSQETQIHTQRRGASQLTSQIHPLLSTRQNREYYKDKPRYTNEPSLSHLLTTARRLFFLLLGQQSTPNSNEEEILHNFLSSKSLRTLRLLFLLPLLFYTTKKYAPPIADKLSSPPEWKWSAGVSTPGHVVPNRNLSGRNCAMNYFIEKQPRDEYDPDFVEPKPGVEAKPISLVEGTYRTKGQVHVISRFIEAVADSFRSNTSVRQHLIFTEVRDSGHLALEALRHWPPRGKFRTMVHVVAGDDGNVNRDEVSRALGYGSLEDIEIRFKGNDKARIYDREGNLAGLIDEEGVDDDETLGEMMEMEVLDGETLELRRRSGRHVNSTLLSDGSMYPDLRLMLPFEEEDEEGEIVVPYLHVDGVSMSQQMQVLEAARSLLLDKTVVVVGIEHSPDMDARRLIAFFREVKYKTFFLGARQIARIDNLCDEVLDDVMDHPSVSPPEPSMLRRLFIKVGLVSKDELRIAPKTKDEAASANRKRETPPFFVAMPRGRKNREEMTIQHMYDLFGGYGGGGGQIKTANDRKAPGK